MVVATHRTKTTRAFDQVTALVSFWARVAGTTGAPWLELCRLSVSDRPSTWLSSTIVGRGIAILSAEVILSLPSTGLLLESKIMCVCEFHKSYWSQLSTTVRYFPNKFNHSNELVVTRIFKIFCFNRNETNVNRPRAMPIMILILCFWKPSNNCPMLCGVQWKSTV